MLTKRMPYDFYWFLMYYHSLEVPCFKIISGKDASESTDTFYNDMDELIKGGKDKCAVIVTSSVRKEYLEDKFDFYIEHFKCANKKYLLLHKSIQTDEVCGLEKKQINDQRTIINLTVNVSDSSKFRETLKIDFAAFRAKHKERTKLADDKKLVIVDQHNKMSMIKQMRSAMKGDSSGDGKEPVLIDESHTKLLKLKYTTSKLKSETVHNHEKASTSTQNKTLSKSKTENIQLQVVSVEENSPVFIDISNSKMPKRKSTTKKIKSETSQDNAKASTNIKRRLFSDSEPENIQSQADSVEENTSLLVDLSNRRLHQIKSPIKKIKSETSEHIAVLPSESETVHITPQVTSAEENSTILTDVSNKMPNVKSKSTAKKIKSETGQDDANASTSTKRRLPSESERENTPPQVATVEEISLEVAGSSNKSKPDDVYISPNNTPVPTKLYDKVNWKDYKVATRKLLMAIFLRETLATHSLSGKSSPAFAHIKPKPRLDPKKIEDIIYTVSTKCSVDPSLVRAQITSKCADENKMLRDRLSKGKK